MHPYEKIDKEWKSIHIIVCGYMIQKLDSEIFDVVRVCVHTHLIQERTPKGKSHNTRPKS